MIELADLVTKVVEAATTGLVSVAGKGAAALAQEMGKGALAWLRAKLPAPGQAALIELQAEPANADTQAELRNHLKRLLTAEPALLNELRALLPAITQTASGNTGSTVIQNTGSNVTITAR